MLNIPHQDWLWFFTFFAGLVFLILISNLLSSKFHVKNEWNRKLVHILTGLFAFYSPYFFDLKWFPIVLGLLFILINSLALWRNWFFAIHRINRASWGTVYFPASYAILVFLFWDSQVYIMQVSMLILGLGDALAGIIGRWVKNPSQFTLMSSVKSLEGSATMYLVSFFSIMGCGVLGVFSEVNWFNLFLTASLVALMVTLAEALFDGGADNLVVPLLSAIFLSFSERFPSDLLFLWMVAAGSIIGVIVFWKVGFLTISGAVATLLIAIPLIGFGGWSWLLPILIFFILSSLLSKLAERLNPQSRQIIEKHGARDAIQVFANGGVPTIILLSTGFVVWEWSYIIFLISIAAATSDTWSTEFGQLLSRGKPFDLFNWKVVEKGESGGMSLWGTMGGFLGSFVIAVVLFIQTDYYFTPITDIVLLITLSGFSGMLIDSFIGARFQVKYKCVICGKSTEKINHCQMKSEQIAGIFWINNDVVNILSILAASLIGSLCYVFIFK